MHFPSSEPADLKKIPRPRIGYTGILKTQIDWSLLLSWRAGIRNCRSSSSAPQTTRRPAWRVRLKRSQHLGNVYFLGGNRPRSLPAFVQHFDVAVMPYRINSYTNHIYPLKLHEYLASGCPVVGSKIRSLYQFRDVVSLAGTVDEWSEALSESLSAPACSRQEVEKRRAVARDHDWDRMVHRIALALCNLAEPESAPRLEALLLRTIKNATLLLPPVRNKVSLSAVMGACLGAFRPDGHGFMESMRTFPGRGDRLVSLFRQSGVVAYPEGPLRFEVQKRKCSFQRTHVLRSPRPYSRPA